MCTNIDFPGRPLASGWTWTNYREICWLQERKNVTNSCGLV